MADAVAGLAIAGFVVVASRTLSSPGLYADEASQIVPALAFLKGHIAQSVVEGTGPAIGIGAHKLHVMTESYFGSVKSVAYAPVAAIFGTGVQAIRGFSIALAALALAAYCAFSRRLFRDAAVAAVAVVLLAADPSFVFYARSDWPPFVFMLLTKTFGGWQLLRWWDTRDGRSLALGMFALGIGQWDKANFAWILAAAAVATVVAVGRPLFARLDRRVVITGVASFAAGCLPLIAYNVRSGFGTVSAVHEVAQRAGTASFPYDEPRTPGGGLFAQIGQRLDVLGRLLDGKEVGRTVGTPFHTFEFLPWIFAFAVFVVCVQLVTRRLESRQARAVVFLLILGAGTLLATAATSGAFHGHHVVLVYPVPHLILAFVLVQAARWIARSFSARRRMAAFAAAAVCLVAVPVAIADVTTGRMLHTFDTAGGRGVWSDAIYPLTRYLEDARAPVVTADWGFDQNVIALSSGRVPLSDDWYELEQGTPAPAKVLAKSVADSRTLYLLHSPRETIDPAARRRFFAGMRQLHVQPTLVRTFNDRGGHPLFDVYRAER
ncbi:MAG TPA: glycosyltransferase family 39 protein [Thermoleophilaceae bacterium]|nr:glycosyltransferase family 39 protein [Thermoleophilaceae bacterium]